MMIHALASGTPKNISNGEHIYTSGIGKDRVEKLTVEIDQIKGDCVENLAFHGGVDRVICVYPFEHYAFWEEVLGSKLRLPAFGENMTVSGMTEREIYIGDIFQIGTSIVQVSQGRIPCSTISKFNQQPSLLNEIIREGYTGYFFRVIQKGIIDIYSSITLLERDEQSLSLLRANQLFFHEKENLNELKKLSNLSGLATDWKEKVRRKMKK
ncbi:MOSC domain-containing protein [Bacillus sp. 2205SS5-2]|uniref:MOSC domain-containing protein n=1 Tax=Bacillus sp. 2205SS5-2 TaxID=3109031 RepID=UPI0030060449